MTAKTIQRIAYWVLLALIWVAAAGSYGWVS